MPSGVNDGPGGDGQEGSVIATFRDRVHVASEKADFIADRIAAGVPAPEREMRRLAQYLRETAAAMSAGSKKPRPGMASPAQI